MITATRTSGKTGGGLFTIVGTALVSEGEENKNTNHDGECFSVSTNDDDCFSVATSQPECFFIKGDEGDKGDKPVFSPDDIDLQKFGIYSIHAIHVQNFDTMYIVANRLHENGDDRLELISLIYSSSSKKYNIYAYTDLETSSGGEIKNTDIFHSLTGSVDTDSMLSLGQFGGYGKTFLYQTVTLNYITKLTRMEYTYSGYIGDECVTGSRGVGVANRCDSFDKTTSILKSNTITWQGVPTGTDYCARMQVVNNGEWITNQYVPVVRHSQSGVDFTYCGGQPEMIGVGCSNGYFIFNYAYNYCVYGKKGGTRFKVASQSNLMLGHFANESWISLVADVNKLIIYDRGDIGSGLGYIHVQPAYVLSYSDFDANDSTIFGDIVHTCSRNSGVITRDNITILIKNNGN